MSREAAAEQPASQLSGAGGQGTETPPPTHLPVCAVCTTAETGPVKNPHMCPLGEVTLKNHCTADVNN